MDIILYILCAIAIHKLLFVDSYINLSKLSVDSFSLDKNNVIFIICDLLNVFLLIILPLKVDASGKQISISFYLVAIYLTAATRVSDLESKGLYLIRTILSLLLYLNILSELNNGPIIKKIWEILNHSL